MTKARDLSQVPNASLAFKNRIINGDMRIDQRNAGASVSSNGSYPVDRFLVSYFADGTFTSQRSTVAPTGFINSLLYTVGTADSNLGTAQYSNIRQRIEGFNTADLAWGTSNAQTVTLSFWVRSSVTGTFGLSISNSADSRIFATSYVVNSANTWEQKTVTIAGDTTGTWATDNGTGIQIQWQLGLGSSYMGATGWNASLYAPNGMTNLLATAGATFYITGVQLEKGSTATSFDYRPYGTEEFLCKRFFQAYVGSLAMRGVGGSAGAVERMGAVLPVEMRTTPTISIPTAIGWYDGYGVGTISSLSGGANYSNPRNVEFSAVYASGSSATGRIIVGYVGVGTLTLSAEL